METSRFNFLKEGLLLPGRNRVLFTAVCALIVLASTAPLLLGNDLAIQPLADEIQLDAKALNTTEPGSPEYARLVQEIKSDAKELLLVGAGYLLFAVVVGSAVRIVALFAAVSTYSGEQRTTATFGALLGQAKAQMKAPLLTLAFVYVLEIVLFAVLLLVTTALVFVLVVKLHLVANLFVALLLGIPAVVCLVYFSFLCSFSIVVAVAEPGCHGAAALREAWTLVKGKRRQVVLYMGATSALTTAVSPVRTLAKTCAGDSVALGLLLGFAYAVLLALVQLFAACAMTALYYERREIIDSQLGATGYAELPTGEEKA